MIGQRFGNLVVIADAGLDAKRRHLWRCLCDCGVESLAIQYNLKNGNTKSCGCGRSRSRHGHSPYRKKSPTYGSWANMIDRCTNKNSRGWPWYGGKGVAVCDEWLSFERFLEDMGERPEGKTLDRVDYTKGYNKENCRWATAKQQGRNTSSVKLDAFKVCNIRAMLDKGISYKELAARYGCSLRNIRSIHNNQRWADIRYMNLPEADRFRRAG